MDVYFVIKQEDNNTYYTGLNQQYEEVLEEHFTERLADAMQFEVETRAYDAMQDMLKGPFIGLHLIKLYKESRW